jgi:hypothetical protein
MKLKILGEQFEAERNAKMHKLKPKIIGCIWEGAGNSFPEFGEYTLSPHSRRIIFSELNFDRLKDTFCNRAII